METLGEFKSRILHPNHPNNYRIRNSWGIYDGFKYYRKNKPNLREYVLTESQYFAITRAVNQLLVEELLMGRDIKLPKAMGSIELRKYEKTVKIGNDGRVHTNLPIDWDKTLELWYSDGEAYKNKTLVRIDSSEMFKIYYNRASANYNNNYYYEFVFHKDFRARLRQRIKEGLIDAFALKKNVRYGE